MPTKHRRHVITETPPVQAALEELRREPDVERLELSELVILGAGAKLAALRARRNGDATLRRRLAARVRSRDVPVDPDAAVEVRASWARK